MLLSASGQRGNYNEQEVETTWRLWDGFGSHAGHRGQEETLLDVRTQLNSWFGTFHQWELVWCTRQDEGKLWGKKLKIFLHKTTNCNFICRKRFGHFYQNTSKNPGVQEIFSWGARKGGGWGNQNQNRISVILRCCQLFEVVQEESDWAVTVVQLRDAAQLQLQPLA